MTIDKCDVPMQGGPPMQERHRFPGMVPIYALDDQLGPIPGAEGVTEGFDQSQGIFAFEAQRVEAEDKEESRGQLEVSV